MSIEEALRHYVRAYEEVMLIDYSAGLFNQHARHGQLTLAQLHGFLSFSSHGATAKVFSIFDEDRSGTIDAHEFHKVVRYLNFTDGYCDACDAPILEHQHSFYCTSCDDYLLCVGCHGQRQRVHNSRHQFRLMCDKESLKEYMPGVGNFLRAEIEQLFRELDADRSGKVTHGEFRVYFRGLGFREALIDHFLQLDLNGDGYLDKNELLCIMVAIRITRFCDECGDGEFPGSGNMLSCIQCTADYDVCRSCFQSGRCSHEHEHYETVSMLQLRRLGLCLEVNGNDRRVVCEDQEKWSLYRPFFGLHVEPRRPYYQNHHPGYSPHGYPPHGYPHQAYPLQGYQYQGYQPHEYPAHAYSYPPSGSTASSFGKQVDNVANIVGAGLVDGFKEGIKDQLMEEFGFEGVVEVVGTLLSWLF